METITIKKSEYDRLKIENETLKKELENTKEPTEFLGKKASEWLALKDLINTLLRYSGTINDFDDFSIQGVKDKIRYILEDTLKLKYFDRCLVDIENRMNELKTELNKELNNNA